MASRPKLSAFCSRIEREGGHHLILDRIANGETMKSIGASYRVSRGLIYDWIKRGGEERRKGFELARKASADSHAEDGLAILDDLGGRPGLSNAEVSAATARANYRRWLASVRNRHEYGEKREAGVNVNMSIGELHLAALIASQPALEDAEGTSEEIQEAEVMPVLPAVDEDEASRYRPNAETP